MLALLVEVGLLGHDPVLHVLAHNHHVVAAEVHSTLPLLGDQTL